MLFDFSTSAAPERLSRSYSFALRLVGSVSSGNHHSWKKGSTHNAALLTGERLPSGAARF